MGLVWRPVGFSWVVTLAWDWGWSWGLGAASQLGGTPSTGAGGLNPCSDGYVLVVMLLIVIPY